MCGPSFFVPYFYLLTLELFPLFCQLSWILMFDRTISIRYLYTYRSIYNSTYSLLIRYVDKYHELRTMFEWLGVFVCANIELYTGRAYSVYACLCLHHKCMCTCTCKCDEPYIRQSQLQQLSDQAQE